MSTHTLAAPQDARHVPLSTADKLRQDAATAGEIRRLSQHPDVIALHAEKVRRLVDMLVWLGIGLGLAFTMVNVQTFAAAGAAPWTLPWLAAWLLDPMVSLTLIAVLRAEQITARYQVRDGLTWAHRTKWFAFLATYVMNTWQSWAVLHPAGIVLHSVPPVLVFLASETAPALRDRLTESVHRAATTTPAAGPEPAPQTGQSTGEAGTVTTTATVQDGTGTTVHADPVRPVREQAPAPVREHRRRPASRSRRPAPAGRKVLADWVADARGHWSPGIEITPAWVREVLPDCKRTTSKNVADALKADIADQATTAPTPPAESSEEAA